MWKHKHVLSEMQMELFPCYQIYLDFFFLSSWSAFLWLVVLFYLMFLGSLPLFWPNLFQDNFSPGLPTQEAAALLEIILCACCCSKQTHSGARYGTTSSCFHYVLLSSMPLWLHEEWYDGLLLLFYLFGKRLMDDSFSHQYGKNSAHVCLRHLLLNAIPDPLLSCCINCCPK